MRKLITILFVCLAFQAKATHYYVSNSGSDANNGTSTSTPWQTISKVNSMQSSLAAGDEISFNGGNVFNGTITISKSGTSGNRIIYDSYGTGSAIMSGFNNVSAWTNLGSNIWISNSAVTSLSDVNMVVIGGAVTAMGRTPNTGYWTYQSHVSNTSFTSSNLSGSPDYSGYEAVARNQEWRVDRYSIGSQSSGTVNVTNKSGSSLPFIDGGGFFIQNGLNTLDQQNEWYFDPATSKLKIYSTSNPGTISVANLDKLFDCENDYSYIEVKNLIFQGSHGHALYFVYNNTNCYIHDNTIQYAGAASIWFQDGSYNTFDNNTILNGNAKGINYNGSNITATNNTIKYLGLVLGLPLTTDDADGIFDYSTGSTIQYNKIDSVGSVGIISANLGAQNVAYNFINHSCLRANDHGGIYYPHTGTSNIGVVIKNNIILNTMGYGDGSPSGYGYASGIYLDDDSYYNTVQYNSVAYSSDHNIKLHSGHYNVVKYNNSYNAPFGSGIQQDGTTAPSGNTWIGNVNFAASGQYVAHWRTDNSTNNFSTFGTIDSNLYISPSKASIIDAALNYSPTLYSLAGWQSYTSMESHSTSDTASITRFDYNATKTDSTITLDATYKDAYGTAYNSGSVLLHPFTSVMLIRTGSLSGIAAPTISMSGSQSITVTNTSVSAAAFPASGQTITGYHWTGSATFGSQNSSSTTVSGLANGTTILSCTATQSDGQTVSGNVSITVNLPLQGISIRISGNKIIYINKN